MVHCYFLPKHKFHCQTAEPPFSNKCRSCRRELRPDAPWGLSVHPHPENVDSQGVRIAGTKEIVDRKLANLHKIELFACINGIIWLALGSTFFSGFSGFFLWNPTIRESKVVRYPRVPKVSCPSCNTTFSMQPYCQIWIWS